MWTTLVSRTTIIVPSPGAVGQIVALRAVMGNPLTLQSDINAVPNDQLHIGNKLTVGKEYPTFSPDGETARDLSATGFL